MFGILHPARGFRMTRKIASFLFFADKDEGDKHFGRQRSVVTLVVVGAFVEKQNAVGLAHGDVVAEKFGVFAVSAEVVFLDELFARIKFVVLAVIFTEERFKLLAAVRLHAERRGAGFHVGWGGEKGQKFFVLVEFEVAFNVHLPVVGRDDEKGIAEAFKHGLGFCAQPADDRLRLFGVHAEMVHGGVGLIAVGVDKLFARVSANCLNVGEEFVVRVPDVAVFIVLIPIFGHDDARRVVRFGFLIEGLVGQNFADVARFDGLARGGIGLGEEVDDAMKFLEVEAPPEPAVFHGVFVGEKGGGRVGRRGREGRGERLADIAAQKGAFG